MTRSIYLLLTCFLLCSPATAQQEILLWPDDHPANQGEGPAVEEVRPNRLVVHHRPSMLVYRPEKFSTGAAMLITPGGGYGRLCMDYEGTELAEWLNAHGVNAFVLKYRCGGGKNQNPAPLDDALRGMRLIRAKAKDWAIDPSRVGVIGFSAGGHLASCVSTLSDDGMAEADDPVERLSSRPNFSVLVYPVISMQAGGVGHMGSRRNLLGNSPSDELIEKFSTYKQITKKTPPTLLVHASDDRGVVPENSILYYQALWKNKVPAELHIYQRGGHGFGMNTLRTKANGWLDDLDAWMEQWKHPNPDLTY